MNAQRRHLRDRVIQRRLQIVRNVWHSDWQPVPGKLARWNLTCDCSACRKYEKDRRERKRRRQDARREIDAELFSSGS